MANDSQLAKRLLGKTAELVAANPGLSEDDVRATFFEWIDHRDVLAILDKYEIPIESVDPEDWDPVITEIAAFAKRRIAAIAATHHTEWTRE